LATALAINDQMPLISIVADVRVWQVHCGCR